MTWRFLPYMPTMAGSMGLMYVTVVPNRKSPPAVLLRESFREETKAGTRTLAALTHWPDAKVAPLLFQDHDRPAAASLPIHRQTRNVPPPTPENSAWRTERRFWWIGSDDWIPSVRSVDP